VRAAHIIPDVENAARLWNDGRVLISYEDRRFYEGDFLFADSTVFDVFTFPFVQGNPKTALTKPFTVVLSATAAQRYFGAENPIGKTLRYDNREDYEVTGVVQDVPATSHFRFDFLASMTSRERSQSPVWISNSFYTYLLLVEGATAAGVEGRFPALVRKYAAPQFEQAVGQRYDELLASGARYDFYLQPLTEIYLHSKAENDFAVTSNIQYLYILSAVALFILLIASINFMNLATARSANRAREVGLRKVLGSARGQLVRQFLGESVLMAMIALVIALVLIEVLLPAFNGLSGKALSVGLFENMGMLATVVGLAMGVGLLAGVYPAFVLSAFKPLVVSPKGTLAIHFCSGINLWDGTGGTLQCN